MSRGDSGKKHKFWTDAERAELVDMYYKQRLKVKTIANHFGVSAQAVYLQIERSKK